MALPKMTAAQAAARKERIHKAAVGRHNAHLNDPQAFGPNTNLTPLQASKDTQAAINLKYGPQTAALNTQVQQTPGWFDAYKAAVGAAQQQAQGINDTIVGNAQQRNTDLTTQDDTARQQILKQMLDDARQRGGATVDTSKFSTAQDAAASRAGANNQAVGTVQQLGGLEQNFLTNQGVIGEGARTQRLGQLHDQLAALKSEAGDYGNTFKQNEISNAQKYGVELGTLNISQQNADTTATKAVTDAATKRASTRNAAKKTDETIRHDKAGEDNAAQARVLKSDSFNLSTAQFQAKYGITPGQALRGVTPKRGLSTTGSSGLPGGITSTQAHKNSTAYRRALGIAETNVTKGKLNSTITHAFANGISDDPKSPVKGIDTLLGVAAAEVALYGGVSAGRAREVYQAFGIRVPVKKFNVGKGSGPATGRNKGERPT